MKSPSPDSPSPALSPSVALSLPPDLDALAEALTSSRPHTDIIKLFNLTRSQLSRLLDTQELSSRVESLERLQALEHKIRITTKLRAAHETSLDKLLEHQQSDDHTESRKAAQTLLRQTTAYLIALDRSTITTRRSQSPSLREGSGWVASDSPPQATGVEANNPIKPASSSFEISNLKSPSPIPPSASFASPIPLSPPTPPPPKPYTTPELLIEHQFQLLREHQPKTPAQAIAVLYDHLDHPIKCILPLKAKLAARIDASTLLQHYNAEYQDMGPVSFDQEVLIPAPITPDLSLKPVLKHFAIKRYAFAREGQTPLYLRIHLAKQDPLKGETTDRWALADIAIDSS